MKQVLARKYRFQDTEYFSPTQHQLAQYMQTAGLQPTRWAWRAKFTERNLNFSPEVCECLEYKHLLAQLVAKHCPTAMPETYILNDYTWSSVLSDVAQTYYYSQSILQDEIDGLVWILKPALLNNGQHIKIFTQLSQIEAYLLQPNHLGGPHVLQRYIPNPSLYEGRKYSLRFFVVITQESGAFLYQQGYLNVALAPYSAVNFSDLSLHVTNEHLNGHTPSIEQVPSSTVPQAVICYSQIYAITQAVTHALEIEFPQAYTSKKDRTFAVFGFDFMLDEQGRTWLLEVNHGPCFPIEQEHPLQSSLYQQFWQDMLAKFVLPIVRQKPITAAAGSCFDALR